MYGIVALRVLVSFVVLLFWTRVTGKKQIAQLSFFDFITAIAAGDMAVESVADPEKPLAPWLFATSLFFALALGLDFLAQKWRWGGKVLQGEPVILVQNGKILEDKLSLTLMTTDNLMGLLRNKGYFNLADVKFAILETDGSLSVLPTAQSRPVTPGDLGQSPPEDGLFTEVVVEGSVLVSNLRRLGKDEPWLQAELSKQGVSNLGEVFWAGLDQNGRLHVDRYRDRIQVQHDISDYPGPS